MIITWRDFLMGAVAAVLSSSCSTSPPGAGVTNGDKATIGAEEKPAVRDDLPGPTPTEPGDARLADPAASATVSTTAEKSAAPNSSANPPAHPPTIESSGAAGAQGGTRPPEPINAGTPRSPQ